MHIKLGARVSVAMHWGTFILSQEGVLQPKADLQAAVLKHGVAPASFLALDIGETITVPPRRSIGVKS